MITFSVLVFVFLIINIINIKSVYGEFKNNNCLNPDEIPGNCIHYRKCDNIYDKLNQPLINNNNPEAQRILKFLKNSYCGVKKNFCCATFPTLEECMIDIEDRIIGGNIAHINDYPWAVLLIYKHESGTINYTCGGALINKNYVITAAHCVHQKTNVRSKLIGVRLGEWDITTEIDCYQKVCNEKVVDVAIDEEIIHARYNPDGKYFDIALLRLNTTIQYTKFIKPICLPWAEYLKHEEYRNDLFLSGWGITSNLNNAAISDKKRELVLKEFNFDECKHVYRDEIRIERTQLCAGAEKGKDSCSYDSGSPLVTFDTTSNIFYLAGLVSFGTKPCALEGYPGVYTRVQSFLDWIEEKVEPNV